MPRTMTCIRQRLMPLIPAVTLAFRGQRRTRRHLQQMETSSLCLYGFVETAQLLQNVLIFSTSLGERVPWVGSDVAG